MIASLGSLRGAVIAFLAIFSVLNPPHPGHRHNRRHGQSHNYAAIRERQQQATIQAALAQRNAAQRVLEAAQATGDGAQDKLNSALAKLRQEAQQFHDAQSTTRQAAKELAEIEEEILDEQAADSPYKLAVKKVEEARQKLKEVEERILEGSVAKSKLAGLSGNNLLEAKTKIFQLDDNYLVAKNDLTAQGSAAARIRTELFQADKQWKDAAESLTQARKEEKEAEANTLGGASGSVGLNSKAKSASEAAAAAKAAIKQAEAVLRANGAGNLINDDSKASNSRPSNKKTKK